MTEETMAVAVHDGKSGPKEIVVLPPDSILPQQSELRLMSMIAQTVVKAKGHAVPASIDTPEKAIAVMLAGWEHGFRPMTALRHYYVVNGRTEPDAQAMQAIVMSRDPSARFEWHDYDQEVCDVTLHRGGVPVVRCRYTLEDARKSGQLAKAGPWQAYTRDMLSWSCIKRVCRLGAPELINLAAVGVEEVGEIVADIGPADMEDVAEVAVALDAIPADAYNEGDEPDESLDGQRALGV